MLREHISYGLQHTPKAILAVVLAKAFDTVKHEHIPREISYMNLGENLNNYTKAFLANTTATIRIGQQCGEPERLGNVHTLQGSVLSPLIFNVAMHRLPEKLDQIPSYTVKAFGFILSAKAGHNTEALKRLEKSTNDFARGIGRIANKRAGLLEDNILKPYHAFLVSHIACAFPFLKLTKVEIKKVDAMLRKGLKTTLGLPNSTSNEKLEQLGLLNTAEEIFEAQKTAQITRLPTTQAGHLILRDAGIRPIFQPDEKTKLTNDVRKHTKVEQIPRNVHPTLNEVRRKDRARALINKAKKHNTHALLVDAARYHGGQAFAVAVVDITGKLLNAATVKTWHAHEAEEMVIAQALQSRRAHYKIHTDSKTATRAFTAGLPSAASAILGGASRLTWGPNGSGSASSGYSE
ncbi:hypothetical protein HPB52_007540 [Rhipicephalus sanguineus]|uniref:Reverse transcriptase domain-containing protein n=1 Tax=Rhipicephalus sanguineus TaxID=34632 RepID=A0A9D4PLX3_RHISA|nr:hypothetical protein HPB52_007540 [Rhipicephalus sanguineus]